MTAPPPDPELFARLLADYQGDKTPEVLAFVEYARSAVAADPPMSFAYHPSGLAVRCSSGAEFVLAASHPDPTSRTPASRTIRTPQGYGGMGMPGLPEVGGAATIDPERRRTKGAKK